jgi:hypothetical protein
MPLASVLAASAALSSPSASAAAGGMAAAQWGVSAGIEVVAGVAVKVAVGILDVAAGVIVAPVVVIIVASVVVVIVVIVVPGLGALIEVRVPVEVLMPFVLVSAASIEVSLLEGVASCVDSLAGPDPRALFAQQLLIRPAVHIGVCSAEFLPELWIAVRNIAAMHRIVPPGPILRRINKVRVVKPIEPDDVDVNTS